MICQKDEERRDFAGRLLGEAFDEVVEEGLAFVEGLDGDALVAAVEADVVAVEEEALDAVGGDAGDAEIFSVGGAHHHHWDYGDAGEDFVGRLGNCLEKVGTNWRGGAGERFIRRLDADFVVGDDLFQGVLHVFE
jgi:hypothetical protein